MKISQVASALAFVSFSVLASAQNSYSVSPSRISTTERFDLQGNFYRFEDRVEDYESTCSRQIFDGYRRVCGYSLFSSINANGLSKVYEENHPPRPPHYDDNEEPNHPSRPPHYDNENDGHHEERPSEPTPVYRCEDVADYHTEEYSCIRSRVVKYPVFDHIETAHIVAEVDAIPESITFDKKCELNFSLRQDVVTVQNGCDFLIASKEQSSSRMGFDQSQKMKIHFLDKQQVLSPLSKKMENYKVSGNTLSFIVGKIINKESVSFDLFVKQKKFLRKDPTLINRTLKKNEFSYKDIDEKSGLITINLAAVVPGFNSKKTNEVTTQMKLKINHVGDLIDGQEIPSLVVSKYLKTN